MGARAGEAGEAPSGVIRGSATRSASWPIQPAVVDRSQDRVVPEANAIRDVTAASALTTREIAPPGGCGLQPVDDWDLSRSVESESGADHASGHDVAEPACRIVRVSRRSPSPAIVDIRMCRSTQQRAESLRTAHLGASAGPAQWAGPASNGPSRAGAVAGRRARRRWRRLSRSTAGWCRRARTGGAARGWWTGGCGWSGRGWR
jgi:hypothetical protein